MIKSGVNRYCVYMVKCSDNSYYTGVTNNLERRIFEHNSEMSPSSYTYSRRPVQLVFAEHFQNIDQAIQFEKRVKGWSRKKKEAIINGSWDKLHELARCRNFTSHLGFGKVDDGLFDSAQSDKAG